MSKAKHKKEQRDEEHEVVVSAHRDCGHFSLDIEIRGNLPAEMEEQMYRRVGLAMQLIVAGPASIKEDDKPPMHPLLAALRKGAPSDLGDLLKDVQDADGHKDGQAFSIVLENPDSDALKKGFEEFMDHIRSHQQPADTEVEGDPSGN